MACPYKIEKQIPSGKAGIFDRCARNYSTFRECYPLLPFPALPFPSLPFFAHPSSQDSHFFYGKSSVILWVTARGRRAG